MRGPGPTPRCSRPIRRFGFASSLGRPPSLSESCRLGAACRPYASRVETWRFGLRGLEVPSRMLASLKART